MGIIMRLVKLSSVEARIRQVKRNKEVSYCFI